MDLTLEQLQALVAPKTQEVFATLRRGGPMSVDELQKQLGTGSKGIYHHVAKLEAAGLVKSSGQMQGKRRLKQVYEAASGSLIVPDGFVSAEYEVAAAKGVAAMLRRCSRRFQKAAELAPSDPKLVDSLLTHTASFSLSDEDFVEMRRRLKELLTEFQGRASGEGKTHQLVSVVTPHESRLG